VLQQPSESQHKLGPRSGIIADQKAGFGPGPACMKLGVFLPQIPKYISAASVRASKVPCSQSPGLVIQGNPKAGDEGCEQKVMVQKNSENIICKLVCWGI